MRFREIPDDVWIEIFENISEPPTLACLVRTCRRFQDLAKKPLLREIRWSQPVSTFRNIDSWRSAYRDLVSLPRKLTLCLSFDTNARNHAHPVSLLCYATFFSHTQELLGIRWHWPLRLCSSTNTIIYWSERACLLQHFHFTFRIYHSCSIAQFTFSHNLRLHILATIHSIQRPCLCQTFSTGRILSIYQSSHHPALPAQSLDAGGKWLQPVPPAPPYHRPEPHVTLHHMEC